MNTAVVVITSDGESASVNDLVSTFMVATASDGDNVSVTV